MNNSFNTNILDNDSMTFTTLTNTLLRDRIDINKDTTILLGYTSIKNKRTENFNILRYDLIKKDTFITIQSTDKQNKIIESNKFSVGKPPSGTPTNSPTGFNSLTDCINDFNCKRKGGYQCEANRTCRTQYAALTCCLNDGSCYSVHLIIQPNILICQLIGPIIPPIFNSLKY